MTLTPPHDPPHTDPQRELERLDPAPDQPSAALAAPDLPPGLIRSIALDVGPLRRHREFRLLFFGRAISMFGSMITFVALPFQVYELTDSSLAVGALGAVGLAAILLLALVGGALADAVDRRRMVQITELTLLGCSAVLALNATLAEPRVWVLYLLAFVMAGMEALQRPSLEALVPRLVEPHELAAASALTSFRGTVAFLAGPALAGVLIDLLGVSAAFCVDGLTFALGLALLARMRAVPPPPDADRPSMRAIIDGLRFARSRQELMGTYIVDIVAMFFGMPMALFPAIAADLGGTGTLGLLYSGPAIGAVLATLTSRWTARVHRHGLAVICAAIVWGLGIIAFGFADSVVVAVLCLAVAGGADMISGIFRSLIWNRTPDHMRGRLAGIEMVSYTSGPMLGHVEAGVVASFAGVKASVISGGVLCVVGVLVCAATLPAFVRYRPPDHVPDSIPAAG